MTQQEFLDKWRHELSGMILEGYMAQARGGELALRMRTAFNMVDQHLKTIYEQLTQATKDSLQQSQKVIAAPPAAKPVNGSVTAESRNGAPVAIGGGTKPLSTPRPAQPATIPIRPKGAS